MNSGSRNKRVGLFFASWLGTRFLFGIELGRLALLRGRPVARIIRFVRQREKLPRSSWTVDPPYSVCVVLDIEQSRLLVHKIPAAGNN